MMPNGSNPDLLKDICKREGFSVDEAIYIGDSLTLDMGMAKTAGV
jgi:phosphoglycolate phosphatase